MKNAFYFDDTYVDDLAVGMYAACNSNIKKHVSSRILGSEEPSKFFFELFHQRKRWAKGYKDLLRHSFQTKYFKYIIIHGLAYHFLWIINILLSALFIYFLGV